MSPEQIQAAQEDTCKKHGAVFVPVSTTTISGLAKSTLGHSPVNGLRHPARLDSSGWYIWCGEEFSYAADFFAPVHTEHIYDELPQAIPFLALPPGYRFLVSENYTDVWFDRNLLDVES
jgi:hypothetical protein